MHFIEIIKWFLYGKVQVLYQYFVIVFNALFALVSKGGTDSDVNIIEDDGKSFFYQFWYDTDFARFEMPPKTTPSDNCPFT